MLILADLNALWQDEISPHVKQGRVVRAGHCHALGRLHHELRRELTDLVGADDANILIANVGAGDGLASLGPMVGSGEGGCRER